MLHHRQETSLHKYSQFHRLAAMRAWDEMRGTGGLENTMGLCKTLVTEVVGQTTISGSQGRGESLASMTWLHTGQVRTPKSEREVTRRAPTTMSLNDAPDLEFWRGLPCPPSCRAPCKPGALGRTWLHSAGPGHIKSQRIKASTSDGEPMVFKSRLVKICACWKWA